MKPGSIVVLGPSYGRYPESIANGFRQNGMETSFFSYPEPPVTAVELLAWEYLPRIGLTALRRSWLDRTVRNVIKACEGARLLVVVKGDQLPLSQYEGLLDRVECPKILWLMDSIQRVDSGTARASMADMVFFFEGADRPALARLSVPHHQVALAADPDWYYPIPGSRRSFDVTFFGRLYDNRMQMLESVLADLTQDVDVTALFVGSYRSRLHPRQTAEFLGRYPLTSQHMKHASHWNHHKINQLNNKSKICLNIFHPQSQDSLNMRTFETCCSGSFLLCESNKALERNFVVGKEVEIFEDAREGAEKIIHYLQNISGAGTIARAGRERVLKDHTIKSRTEQILAFLKSEGFL